MRCVCGMCYVRWTMWSGWCVVYALSCVLCRVVCFVVVCCVSEVCHFTSGWSMTHDVHTAFL